MRKQGRGESYFFPINVRWHTYKVDVRRRGLQYAWCYVYLGDGAGGGKGGGVAVGEMIEAAAWMAQE